MQRIFNQDIDAFLVRPAPIAVQRAMAFLGFGTTRSGGIRLDGVIGAGTRGGMAMFADERTGSRLGDLHVEMVDAVAGKCRRIGPDHTRRCAGFLDRIEHGRLMSIDELGAAYFPAVAGHGALVEAGVDPLLILAIAYVESGGVPSTRFERHIWNRRKGIVDLRRRRYLSTSFGLWQIMGFNLERLDFPGDFLDDAADLERQLLSLAAFLRTDGALLEACHDADYARIARRYNGPAFLKNRYDAKLRRAHRRMQQSQGA